MAMTSLYHPSTSSIPYLVTNQLKSVDLNDTETRSKISLYNYMIPGIGITIIIVNLIVVISSGLILKKGQQPKTTYLLLGNVAMSDLVTGCAVLFGVFYPKNLRDQHICAGQLGLIISSSIVSIYSVGLIAIDRYLYILYGLHYQTWVTSKRVRIMIVITWLMACIIGFLPLMGWNQDQENGKFCWFIIIAPRVLILLTVQIGVIPLIIVFVLYSIILFKAIQKITEYKNSQLSKSEDNSSGLRVFRGKSNKENSEQNNRTNKSINFKTDPSIWKAIKVVVFTTGCFAITWLPYYMACIVYTLLCDIDSRDKQCTRLRSLIASPLAILIFINSLLNPLIYAWWHKGFRYYFKGLLKFILIGRRKRTMDVNKSQFNTNISLSDAKVRESSSSQATINSSV